MMIIDFTFQHLGSSHSTVSRLALQVNILAACNTATGCSGVTVLGLVLAQRLIQVAAWTTS